jgi:hypothetical protein
MPLRTTRVLAVALAVCAFVSALGPATAVARTKRLPALVPARSDALTRALATERITAGRYALERVRSAFDLAAVRGHFGDVDRPEPRSMTLLLRDLAIRLDQLSGPERRAAARILARPTDAHPQDPDGYSVDEETPECGANTCVHYVASSDDVAEAGYVATVSSVVEQVWAEEVTGLGYRAPKSDLTSPDDGGSARLDVYLVDIGGDGLYGYCTSDDPNLSPSYAFWDVSAYCVLDNDYHPDQYGYPDPMDPLRVTAAHELFHAVQFAYDFGEDGWLMEGTATWVEDEVYDGVDDNLQYLDASPLAQPLIPLDRSTSPRWYGTWIFWRFLAEYFDRVAVVRSVWNRADGSPAGSDTYSTQALAATVNSQTIGGTRWRFRWAFADFAVWNARPATHYDEGAAYPRATIAATVTLRGTTRSTRHTASLDHLTNRFVAVRRGTGLPVSARLRVTVDGPGNATGPEASVIVIRKSGASRSRDVALDTSGNGAVTVAFDGTVARVIVIVTNASTRYTDCYAGATPFACAGGTPLDENRTFAFRATIV